MPCQSLQQQRDNRAVLKSRVQKPKKQSRSYLAEMPVEMLEKVYEHLSAADMMRMRATSSQHRELLDWSSAVAVFRASKRGLEIEKSGLTLHPALSDLRPPPKKDVQYHPCWEFLDYPDCPSGMITIKFDPKHYVQTRTKLFADPKIIDRGTTWKRMQVCQPAVSAMELHMVELSEPKLLFGGKYEKDRQVWTLYDPSSGAYKPRSGRKGTMVSADGGVTMGALFDAMYLFMDDNKRRSGPRFEKRFSKDENQFTFTWKIAKTAT